MDQNLEHNDDQEIKDLHDGSLKNLLKILNSNNSFSLKKSPLGISIIIGLAICIGGELNNMDIFNFIQIIVDLALSILPDLLGFTLAGLTIIIAFGNTEYLKSLSKIKNGPKGLKPSFFQKIVAVFTWAVLVQGVTLSTGYLLKVIQELKIPVFPIIGNTHFLELTINYLVLFWMALTLTYSILLLPKTVLNVFRFGQGHHFKLYLENKKQKKD